MHPDNPQAALAAFFRRHDIAIPAGPAPLMARMGLVLTLAAHLLSGRRHVETRGSNPLFFVGGMAFDQAEFTAVLHPALLLADLQESILSPIVRPVLVVDRMAFLMRRAAEAGIAAGADYLSREGYATGKIAEHGPAAVELALAMARAERAYADLRRQRDAAPEAA